MSPLDTESFATELTRRAGDAPVYVALSGGLDSVVLLDLAARAGRAAGAVHVDHGLHPDSAAWARFAARLCAARGLAYYATRVSVEPGADLEARARTARYAACESLLPVGAVLATAHHGDDQAETVLLRLLRGAGVEGLVGIAERRRQGALTLVRPLLGWRRSALHAYAHRRDLRWIEDPSNRSPAHDRNYLRREILPRLENRWPDVPARLERVARHAAGTREMAGWAADQLGVGPGPLPVARLRGVPATVAETVLREWLRQGGYRPPAEARLRQGLHDLMSAAADRQPVLAWPDGEVRRHDGRLYRLPPGVATRARIPPRSVPDTTLEIPAVGRLHWQQAPAGSGLPAARIAELTLDFDFTGARLRDRGDGHRRRVKELYRVYGLASWERGWIPVLRLGDEAVAVPGLGVDARLAVAGGWLPVWVPELPSACDVSEGFAALLERSDPVL